MSNYLLTTDVLSEGQNLQDGHIIVNYDLPWAIIRLIQRAGRVDRIGQKAPEILCYSFLPEDGLNRIIHLRQRLRQRIQENAEVVGSDETFFDGDPINIQDMYNEKSGIFDEGEDSEVDLASFAYQIWKTATDLEPGLAKTVADMPSVVYAPKPIPLPMKKKGSSFMPEPGGQATKQIRRASVVRNFLIMFTTTLWNVFAACHDPHAWFTVDFVTPAATQPHHSPIKKNGWFIFTEILVDTCVYGCPWPNRRSNRTVAPNG